MTEENQGISASGRVSGKMFLYQEPELLTAETHASMGFTPAERPFDFVKSERAIPLTLTEFSSAQRTYPIIFSNMKNPLPLSIVGLFDEGNLYVDEQGNWDSLCYVPTYLRCYPFAFATEGGGRLAVVVDRAADSVSENPQYPFFVGDKVSEHADALMRLCAQYDAERHRTIDFCNRLVELGLLTPLRATYTPDGATEAELLAEYIGIDTDRLNALSKDEVFDLHSAGYLSAIYLQLYSLENWRHLMARRELQSQRAA